MPLPGPRESVPSATVFRSTWILSSHEGLRANGHWERYLHALTDHREEILSTVAGVWMPMHVALAHYRACDKLDLSSDEVTAMARGDGGRVRRAWYAPLATVARAEPSPWATLSQLHMLWRRAADGGAVALFRTGERDARVEYLGCELFEIPYFRQALRAALLMLAEYLGDRATVSIAAHGLPGEVHFQIGWAP